MSTNRKPIYTGVDPVLVSDIGATLEENLEHFDFVVCNLAHPRFERDFSNLLTDDPPPFTRSDIELTSNQWGSYVVGKISPWINPDSENYETRTNSEKAIKQEIEWAAHLGLPAMIFPTPYPPYENYARVVNQNLIRNLSTNVWIKIPMKSVSDPSEDPWNWWNGFRTLSSHHHKLSVALQFESDLPDQEHMDRWFGEPVQVIILPTNIFLTNRKGFPVLSTAHQKAVQRFSKLKIQFVISGKTTFSDGYVNYLKYIKHVVGMMPEMSPQEAFESPFYDYLQAPLQPLMNNLESQTYETFEQDPVKYLRYKQAIKLALEENFLNQYVVIMVVGAGRGPLVAAAIEAARLANHLRYRIYAVEKNPNAIVTLKNKLVSEGWQDFVKVIDSDMRVWNAPEKADILVSELLGSFGDNELSPECLDGAQRFLKDSGISIPQSYTSYLAPLSSQKIWSDVDVYGSKNLKQFETGYVIKAFNAYTIAPPQSVFTFHHPNHDRIIDNNRYKRMTFKASLDVMMYGCIGYFSTVLYKNISLSILPETYSTGMFSWFPIFFPIRFPMMVKAGDEIEIEMWRVCDDKKVWYEWGVSKPFNSTIHNPNGRSHWIGL